MRALRDIWREIMTPSDGRESAYLSLLIAVAHALIGAALSAWLPAVGVAALVRLALPSIYALVKERRDMARGGSWRDSMVDTAFVGLGGFYSGSTWWPVAVLAAATLAAIMADPPRANPAPDTDEDPG